MRIHENAELVRFNGLGVPEPVDEIRVIGSGRPYGALFIKRMWNPNMTMEQTAKLALFIIELIQDTKMNASVGYKEDCLPQVFYLPNLKIDESLRKARRNMTEEQIQKKADELHKEQPIQELPEETIRDYLKTVGSIKSRLIELLKESQLSL